MSTLRAIFQQVHDDLLFPKVASSAEHPPPPVPLCTTPKLALFITSHRDLFEKAVIELRKKSRTTVIWQCLLERLRLPPSANALGRREDSGWNELLSLELQQQLKDLWYVAHSDAAFGI